MSATASPSRLRPSPSRRSARAFTLAELLVVIGIIVLLISILVPVVGRVRVTAQATDTAALIRAIDAACQTYQQDHRAWPGPLADSQLGWDPTNGAVDSGIICGGVSGDGFFRLASTTDTLMGVTGAENLVLGLLGGLVPYDHDGDSATPPVPAYDPAAVGRGPAKLDVSRTPGSHPPYLPDVREPDLTMHPIGDLDFSWRASDTLLVLDPTNEQEKYGGYVDEAAAARDTLIPEFLDRFSSPLPILYMRARPTARISAQTIGDTDGKAIATDDSTIGGVYDVRHVLGYTGSTGLGSGVIGGSKSPAEPYHVNGTLVAPQPAPLYHGLQVFSGLSLPSDDTAPAALRNSMNKADPLYTYPYDARAYLLSPQAANARQADRYVLISAGADRIYGTDDDITNFGSVK